MKSIETLLLAVLGGFTAVCLYLTKEFNETAALFPRVIAIASLVFCAVLIFREIWGRRKGNMGSDPSRDESRVDSTEIPQRRGSDPIFPFLRPQILAGQAAYILLIYLLGFFIATLGFLLIAPAQIGYKRSGIVSIHAVLVTLALTGSFMWLFNVQLPAGAVWDLW
jgi:hypothetical protein